MSSRVEIAQMTTITEELFPDEMPTRDQLDGIIALVHDLGARFVGDAAMLGVVAPEPGEPWRYDQIIPGDA